MNTRSASSRHAARPRPHAGSSMLWLGLCYAALVVYGTLFPLAEWSPPLSGWSHPITQDWPNSASRIDIIINVLAYVPLGLFLALWLRRWTAPLAAAIVVAAFGCGLSYILELLQSALPSRVPSLLDWVTNSAGSLLGGVAAAAFDPRLPVGRQFQRWREAWFDKGTLINIALVILGLWALTQTAPFVPSLDWGNLKTGMKPLGNTLRHPESFRPADAVAMGLSLLSLGLIAMHAARRPVFVPFMAFSLAILLAKVPIVGRQITLEALAGWGGAMPALFAMQRLSPTLRLGLSGFALTGSYMLAQFKPGILPGTHAINWVPFQGQVGTLAGMSDILETLLPFMALGLCARWLTPWRWRQALMLTGMLGVFALAFSVEWLQQSIPGRFADITDVLLASLGWILPWLFADTRGLPAKTAAAPVSRQMRWAFPAMSALVISVGVAGWFAGSHMKIDTDERGRAMLTAPEDLAPLHLPGFHHAHPRLPHPSRTDIARLRAENPQWLQGMKRLARGGAGQFDAVITMAYIEPGSQNLGLLHRRLMETPYSYRGAQAKPVALAYDWLYDQWDDAQRRALREKLAKGVKFLVELIRKDRLSPYNVYLYNSPLQSLLAANLALYGDDPRGELNMRFTYDLWKNRVLPAWRQVMGQNGGWHEGGEYVGIGIGQAVYQAPAMWRSATGEDLFKTEPGLRGFLDFITYRKRPDNTDFRWGDGAFHDRVIPDLLPLALEYRHAAAYNVRPPNTRPTPSGWPWGPLTDATLLNPAANHALPLSKHFDGIGMVVARSNWAPDATYVTFKAGDNFWSHSHLDQGAFTIYKGGALAIDSGAYAPRYGSDHHMNYSYQSIAHNLVTVTDPDDTAPSSGKIVRSIANDGGQRRVGSGWGLESAPIDLHDWLEKRDLYHTGKLERYFDRHDSVVAVADVTPAYTHSRSGDREFSHRTRRVERMWRTFIYDRASDVIIVRDVVKSTRAAFRKRWLLHSQTEPAIAGNGFQLSLPGNGTTHSGGTLAAHVLLPESAKLEKVGGPGFEFFVDGRNYDEDGAVAEIAAQKHRTIEPGNWRMEISPPTAQQDDEFLVVLVPRGPGAATPRIRKLAAGREHGVEIDGPHGIRRWWFAADRNGVRMEAGGTSESIFAEPPEPDPGSWLWNWIKQRWQQARD